MTDSSIDFLKGTLDLMILKTLSWAPTHGYGIARWIEAVTRETLSIEEGSLYPALRRLSDRGWVDSRWAISDTNRRVRLYSLTAKGRTHLEQEAMTWMAFSRAVTQVLRTDPSLV